MSTLPSPTSSSTGSYFGGTAKHRLPANAYIKSSKSVSFSYSGDNTTFQLGILGDSDSYLVGTLHLNYGKQYQVRNIILNLKGTEKTTWYKAQARTKAIYTGEQIVVDHSQEIWKSDDKNVLNLDIPFKIKLPYNLPESIITELGTVDYVLRATINRKGGLMSSSTQTIEVHCPLKRTLTLDNSNITSYQLRGESRSGVDYSFTLPPNKNFNLGTYVTIPIRMKFVRPGVSVERIELALKCCMDFRCSNPNETRHVKENVVSLIIPRQEIRTQNMDGEYTHTVNLFIPRSVQPTYSGRFISITHQFCIKFCLWGANDDFQVEESVRVANIQEKFSNNNNNNNINNNNINHNNINHNNNNIIQENFISSHTPPPQQPSPQIIPQIQQPINRSHQQISTVSPYSEAYPEVYPTYAEGYYPAYDPDEVGAAVYFDYQSDYNYKINLHNPPQVHALNASPYLYNQKEGGDGYGELYPPGLASALNANDLWYRQQLAALHHQQQLYNKKSQSPIPRPPTNHSRQTSENSSHLNAIMMNDSVLPPSPSISPSRLTPSNNTSVKLPPYPAPEHIYPRHSPKLAEKSQTPQQQQTDLSNRKESKLDPHLAPSPPSYRERSTPTPEDVYTKNYI